LSDIVSGKLRIAYVKLNAANNSKIELQRSMSMKSCRKEEYIKAHLNTSKY